MKLLLALLCVSLVTSAVPAQMTSPSASSSTPLNASNAPTAVSSSDLDRLQSAAAESQLDLGRMRIDKWKTDSESKHQAQANADSVQRNLTSALPQLIQAVRTAPQDLNANFKLYRNLNALYDVMATLTESAGAFGPRSDYQALSQQLETIDSVRRNLGDSLERLTSSSQAEIVQLRSQLRAEQQRAAAAAAIPAKKVVVDDTVPKTTTHKKKTTSKKPAGSSSSTPQNGPNTAGGTTNSPSQTPTTH